MKVHFILYVSDQEISTAFYEKVLKKKPDLNVPGMTEFKLNDCILGLMPVSGIKKLLGEKIKDPDLARGIPRSEVYLLVEQPEKFHERALNAGAAELSELSPRNWGDEAAYSSDPDGHILVFARKSKQI